MKLSSFENKLLSYFKRAKPASIAGLKVIFGKQWDLYPKDVETESMAEILVGLYSRLAYVNPKLSHKLNLHRLLDDNQPRRVQAPNYFGLVRDKNDYWENLIAVMGSHFKHLTRNELEVVGFVLTTEFDEVKTNPGVQVEVAGAKNIIVHVHDEHKLWLV